MLRKIATKTRAPLQFRRIADAPSSQAPDAALLRSILENETLDLTALYTVVDLVGRDAEDDLADRGADLGLLLCALMYALSEGGLCLRVDDPANLAALLERLAPRGAGGDDDGARRRIEQEYVERATRLVAYVRSPIFAEHPLVAVFAARTGGPESVLPFRPLVYEREAGFLYFQKHFEYKRAVARKVAAFFARPLDAGVLDQPAAGARCRAALRDVLETRPVRSGTGSPLRMALAQQLAIMLGMMGVAGDHRDAPEPGVETPGPQRGGFLIITGGPGTGKTSTVLNLLRALVRQGLRTQHIALAAPTGRAARRLTESLQGGLGSIAEPASDDLLLESLRGVTLHQLLGFQPALNRFAHDAANPLDVDLLIVDEVSMVDAALMAHLLAAIDVDRTLLVFLGDRDQLPSVDAGAVLADFLRLLAPEDRSPLYSPAVLRHAREYLPDFASAADVAFRVSESAGSGFSGSAGAIDGSLTDRIVQLTESFRSGDAILSVAAAMNAGRIAIVRDAELLPELPPAGQDAARQQRDWPAAGCFRIDLAGEDMPAEREAVILDWLSAHFDEGYLRLARSSVDLEDSLAANAILREVFGYIARSRILAVVRRGRSGVAGVNRVAARWLATRLGRRTGGPDRPGEFAYFAGLPILIVRNDHRRELYNGDVGVVLKTRAGADGEVALRAYFERPGGRFASFPVAVLPEHEAAFALTVHKSQGSEYERLLLLLPDDADHRLLSREVIYTGLTRARRLAVLCGSAAALETAVSRKLIRETGSLFEFDRS